MDPLVKALGTEFMDTPIEEIRKDVERASTRGTFVTARCHEKVNGDWHPCLRNLWFPFSTGPDSTGTFWRSGSTSGLAINSTTQFGDLHKQHVANIAMSNSRSVNKIKACISRLFLRKLEAS